MEHDAGFLVVSYPSEKPKFDLQLSADVLLSINDDKAGIIGIYCAGGNGKTTLLQGLQDTINRDTRTKIEFDHVVWVLASEAFTLEKLQHDVAMGLGLPLERQGDSLAARIREFLKNKSFLLLIDDLRKPVDLVAAGIPYPSPRGASHGSSSRALGLGHHKCTIVFTTWFKSVCDAMGAEKRIMVDLTCTVDERNGLREQADRQRRAAISRCTVDKDLFVLVVSPFPLFSSNPAKPTRRIPKGRHRVTPFRDSSPSRSSVVDLFFRSSKIRFSDQSLPDVSLRECIACFTLYPENYYLDKTELIDCWMGLGIIDDFHEIDEAYSRGDLLIEKLKVTHILKLRRNGDSMLKMNRMYLTKALLGAGELGKNRKKWMVQAGAGLIEAPEEADKWSRAERISLMCNDIQVLPHKLPSCPRLEVLMLQKNPNLFMISGSLFSSFPSLTYLDLSCTSIKSLPREIGSLVKLRHLNVSRTCIALLPKELGALEHLKFLYLEGTPALETIPNGVITRLSNLLVLDLYRSKLADWQVKAGAGGSKVLCLEDLEHLKDLKSLGITIRTESALQTLSTMSAGASARSLCITRLKGASSRYLSAADFACGNLRNLHRLTVEECYVLEELAMGAEMDSKWSLPKLLSLDLLGLLELDRVLWKDKAPGRCLPCLRTLKIDRCRRLRNVSWVSAISTLEELELSTCPLVELLVTAEDDGKEKALVFEGRGEPFTSLKRMTLVDLPRLEGISVSTLNFPSLKSMYIFHCPALKKLSIKLRTAKRISRIEATKEWWDSLQWDDERTKASLLPKFMELWSS